MSTKMNGRERMAVQRLKQDYLRIIKDPVPYILAHPLGQNILEWHYCITGPEDSPYEGGVYHGKLKFPTEYPFKPPSIYIITPNGRFRTNTRLCLSISDFHPDTWNPAWSVATILTGLLSFMLESAPTMGSIETTSYEKKQLALKSLAYNVKDPVFCDLFPDMLKMHNTKGLEEKKKKAKSVEKDAPAKQEVVANGANKNTIGYQFLNDEMVPPERNNALFNHPFVGSTLTNLMVLFGFAAFALTVKYVLGNVD